MKAEVAREPIIDKSVAKELIQSISNEIEKELNERGKNLNELMDITEEGY